MKKIFLILSSMLLLASCSAQLDERVVSKYPSGQIRVVHYFDKHDKCVKETEYYENGQDGRGVDGLFHRRSCAEPRLL